jgi:hypothetical protein
MRRFLCAAGLSAIALIAAPAAFAGPTLHVGAVEDAAIWSNPNSQMDLARQAGYDSIRMTVQWTAGATSPSSALIARVRSATNAAVSRGIQPIVSIYNTSSTATPADAGSQAQFVRFVRSVVSSLPAVTTFIVGNEPNSNYYWLPQFDAAGADVAAIAYEQLLAASYDAIKAVRPTATVVGGALDSRGSDDPNGARQSHSPTTFIHDLGVAYRASGRTTPIMDVFDQHVYADNSSLPPSMSHASSPTIAEGDYTKLVALLAAAFDGTAQRGSSLPILYGEFGVESIIPPEKAHAYSGVEPDGSGAIDEATQGRYYTEAFKLALCQPNVVGILVFHVQDESSLGGWQSGAYYADGTPKSSFTAIRDAATAARAGTIASCPDAVAPAVTISGPATDGTVTATATDDVGVGRVELFVNGVAAGVKFAAPYSFPWLPRVPGRYTLEARSYDAAGNVGRAAITVGAVKATRGGASSPGGWTFGPPPANDLFAAAQRVSASHGHATGSTAFASSERGEPARRSVWFMWRAPADGLLRLGAGNAHVSVYTGTALPRLHRVAPAAAAFPVRRGTMYRIAVDGGHGTFTLAWR